eukprot:1359989-Pyramimonas_sp.AAC.1
MPPFGRDYILIDGTLSLPKSKQISEEEFGRLYSRCDRAADLVNLGLEHEELTYEGFLDHGRRSPLLARP